MEMFEIVEFVSKVGGVIFVRGYLFCREEGMVFYLNILCKFVVFFIVVK